MEIQVHIYAKMLWGYLNVGVVQRLVALSEEVDLGGSSLHGHDHCMKRFKLKYNFMTCAACVCVSVCVCTCRRVCLCVLNMILGCY